MKLGRTRQCKRCPWPVDVDPRDIPNGYDEAMHRELVETIAAPGDIESVLSGTAPLRSMSCHEHAPGAEAHCVGWLVNQLGRGNNIALRLAMMDCENVHELRTIGEQHERFEDTLPDNLSDTARADETHSSTETCQ